VANEPDKQIAKEFFFPFSSSWGWVYSSRASCRSPVRSSSTASEINWILLLHVVIQQQGKGSNQVHSWKSNLEYRKHSPLLVLSVTAHAEFNAYSFHSLCANADIPCNSIIIIIIPPKSIHSQTFLLRWNNLPLVPVLKDSRLQKLTWSHSALIKKKNLVYVRGTWRGLTLLSCEHFCSRKKVCDTKFNCRGRVSFTVKLRQDLLLLYAMWEMRLTWWLFSGIQERERDLIHS
jgi:hypothetical protein